MTKLKIGLVAGLVMTAGIAAGAAFAASGPTPPGALPPTSITVYELPNFKGQSLTFERRVPSLAALSFNDKTTSVKINGKRDWVLCEHRNFMGKCVRVHLKEKDLKRLQFAGKASSLYPVTVEAPPPHKPR
ncbi:MAG: beta/gamma crystallin-related protein [Micropepsaceae bacterium]